MAQQNFGNGLMYDPETGAVVINDAQNNPIYQFDPTSNKTMYNGQSYAGRYNPAVLGLVTDQQMTSAYDPLIAGQNKYTDTNTQAGKYFQGLTQDSANSIAFSNAYAAANKNASSDQQGFFDTLKSMAASRGQQDNSPTASDIAAQQKLMAAEKATAAPPAVSPQNQPTAPTQPSQVQQSTPDASPQATQPDYTAFLQALYSQVQPYMSSLSTPAASNTPATPANSAYTSRPFSLGTQTSTPALSPGGYNPQTSYSGPTEGSSGKGSPTQSSDSTGMATGQFGSK